MTETDPSVVTQARLLIVDPQPAMRQLLGEFLSPFYRLSLAAGGKEALTIL